MSAAAPGHTSGSGPPIHIPPISIPPIVHAPPIAVTAVAGGGGGGGAGGPSAMAASPTVNVSPDYFLPVRPLCLRCCHSAHSADCACGCVAVCVQDESYEEYTFFHPSSADAKTMTTSTVSERTRSTPRTLLLLTDPLSC
jgi:hypothetical protein